MKLGFLRVCAGLLAVAVLATASSFAQDKRKLTTVQTASAKPVEVRYLNLPWGPVTFSYLEEGGNQYYSTRTWPLAHLKLNGKASFNGKTLNPGDYVVVISPKGVEQAMSLSISSFKPDASGTFLKAGNVFSDTPKDAVEVTKKAVTFTKGNEMSDELKIEVAPSKKGEISMKIHYGDRLLTETFSVN